LQNEGKYLLLCSRKTNTDCFVKLVKINVKLAHAMQAMQTPHWTGTCRHAADRFVWILLAAYGQKGLGSKVPTDVKEHQRRTQGWVWVWY